MGEVNESLSRQPGRRAYALVTLFAAALVLLPFLFWYDTWFGRRLSDEQIGQYLTEAGKPRHAQHALVQIGERLARGDRSVRRWYPQVERLAASPSDELRQTAAWLMGQDPGEAEFHEVLRKLCQDRSPLVRRNAALSLAAFGDPAGRPELRAMLAPAQIDSPASGKVSFRLSEGDYVKRGTLVARVGAAEVRSTLPGEIRALRQREGAQIAAGEPVLELAPDKEQVWEALRALYLVGDARDAGLIRPYARGVAGLPHRFQEQAGLTLRAIQARAAFR